MIDEGSIRKRAEKRNKRYACGEKNRLPAIKKDPILEGQDEARKV